MTKPVLAQRVLSLVSVAFSLALVAALFACYWRFDSQLALAQAADSFMDVFTAAVLAWTVSVGARPRDEDHPFGHTRAEPIGALVAAVIAGVLAFEVARNAIDALASGRHAQTDWLLLAVFCVKTAFKGGMFAAAGAVLRRGPSPALSALRLDARNDVLLGLVAIGGFFGARHGMPALDALLALPVAGWIAHSGVRLARDNIRLLMGEAPSEKRQAELLALAARVPGVHKTPSLRAHFVGTELHLHVIIIVDAALPLRDAHDIGEAVRERLESEPDVGHCSVHIDIE